MFIFQVIPSLIATPNKMKSETNAMHIDIVKDDKHLPIKNVERFKGFDKK
jgi:hypothetical protein